MGPPEPPPPGDGSGGWTAPGAAEAALAGWRVDAAAEARRRHRWLADAARLEATVAGLVADAAERGTVVSAVLTGGDRVVGRAWWGSPHVVALRRSGADDVLVALAAVAVVRLGGDDAAPPPQGRTVPVAGDGSLAEALAGLVGDRPQVALRAADGAPLAGGQLVAVGRDVATVATEAGLAHVALAAVATASWRTG